MALFRPGPIISALSGNLAGANFAITRYGPVTRKRLIRIKKRSTRQLSRRAKHQQGIHAWRDMQSLQRLNWNTAATQVVFLNRLGIPRRISGFHLFLKYNMAFYAATTFNLTPPLNLFPLPMPYDLDFQASLAGTFTIFYDQVPPPGDTIATSIYGSRSFKEVMPKHWTHWRFLKTLESAVPHPSTDVQAEFYTAFGVPAQGEKIAVKLVSWHFAFLPSAAAITGTNTKP